MMRSWVGLTVSAAAREVEADIALAAGSDARVLISGERGVGKATIARLIHARGWRGGGPFIPVRCPGIPEPLLETHLFGPPAQRDRAETPPRRGAFASADGGTLFLAGIGEVGPRIQERLFQAIHSSTDAPEGTRRRADARLIASTEASILDQVAAGDFREDLFYRLNVLHIHVPPLRDRREDIAVLLTEILARTAAVADRQMPELSADAWRSLCNYDWPGNLVEMRRVAGSLVGQARTRPISVHDLPREISPSGGSAGVHHV